MIPIVVVIIIMIIIIAFNSSKSTGTDNTPVQQMAVPTRFLLREGEGRQWGLGGRKKKNGGCCCFYFWLLESFFYTAEHDTETFMEVKMRLDIFSTGKLEIY